MYIYIYCSSWESWTKLEASGDPFEIRLISLIGDEKLVSVEPSSNIAELQKLAAEALNWERPWCIKFAQGGSAISTSSPETTLHRSWVSWRTVS